MKITEMKKIDFNSVPERKHWSDKVELFNSLVIIPTMRKHDSGYMCMDFCAVDINDEPICLLSGCSDVLHIDGIGGYGEFNGAIAKSRPIEGLEHRLFALWILENLL